MTAVHCRNQVAGSCSDTTHHHPPAPGGWLSTIPTSDWLMGERDKSVSPLLSHLLTARHSQKINCVCWIKKSFLSLCGCSAQLSHCAQRFSLTRRSQVSSGSVEKFCTGDTEVQNVMRPVFWSMFIWIGFDCFHGESLTSLWNIMNCVCSPQMRWDDVTAAGWKHCCSVNLPQLFILLHWFNP